MSNILVTGGCGYVGSNLINFLVKKGHFVRSIDIIEPVNPIENVEYIKGSICNKDLVDKSLREIDFVYHNAVYIPFLARKKKVYEVNIVGLTNLLDNCIKNSIQKVIITSSSSVLGKCEKIPIENDRKSAPKDFYGKVRDLAESIALSYVKKGLQIIIFRPHLIIGPGREGIFGNIFKKITQGKNLWLPKSIKYFHQLVNIKDFVDALWRALDYSQSDIFNIGGETNFTLEELIKDSISRIESKSKIKIIPHVFFKCSELIDNLFGYSLLGAHRILTFRNGFVFENSYIREKLNWNPRYSDYETWIDCYDSYLTKHCDQVSRYSGIFTNSK